MLFQVLVTGKEFIHECYPGGALILQFLCYRLKFEVCPHGFCYKFINSYFSVSVTLFFKIVVVSTHA